MVSKEQYLLRVRRGSEVDNILEALTNGAYYSSEEVREIGGLSRSHPLAKTWLDKWFDNVSTDVDRETGDYRLNYVNVRPTVVQHIDTAEFSAAGVGGATVSDAEVGEMIWPDAPPLIAKMENFRRPNYMDTMEAMVKLGKHVSLAGPPGVGKSTAIEQMAAERGIPLVNVSADAGLRRRDLVGTTEIVNGTTKFTVAEYAAAVVNGWWVKIDEINAADPDVILFINSQLAPPHVINIHGRQYAVHPNFRLFVTYNPGLVGTKPLPPAFKDRFYPIKMGFPSEYQLRRMLEAHGLPGADSFTVWSADVLKFAARMWEAHERGQMRYQISPRRLIDAIDLMNGDLCSDVRDALKMAVIATIDSPLEAKTAEQILGGM